MPAPPAPVAGPPLARRCDNTAARTRSTERPRRHIRLGQARARAPHGEQGSASRSTMPRLPGGAHTSWSVGPKSVTVGVPARAARWATPQSPLNTSAVRER